MLLFSANFLPQQMKKQKLLGSLAKKAIFWGATNKIKQPIFRGMDMGIMFLQIGTNKPSFTPCCALLPRWWPQGQPVASELEAFCQIAVLCKCNTCLSISEICCSVTLTGSLGAEHWTFTKQMCSGEFYTAPTEIVCWEIHRADAASRAVCFWLYMERLSSSSK